MPGTGSPRRLLITIAARAGSLLTGFLAGAVMAGGALVAYVNPVLLPIPLAGVALLFVAARLSGAKLRAWAPGSDDEKENLVVAVMIVLVIVGGVMGFIVTGIGLSCDSSFMPHDLLVHC